MSPVFHSPLRETLIRNTNAQLFFYFRLNVASMNRMQQGDDSRFQASEN